ncbi:MULTISPECIES: four helix bundle protein [unclassified Moorena]|uniref:four helix bundle protein n=1 Tax=unclassified Moorena TaxID=2683338 RepID=UPI0025EA62BD|nr:MULTISPECIES: four helix bundle protein [unclassified Moorena]
MNILKSSQLKKNIHCLDAIASGGNPQDRAASLTDQIRRSSRSVCANLAEAWIKRRYKAAFVAKLNDCEAEAAETQVWLTFAVKCQYLTVEQVRELYGNYNQILSGLVKMITNPDNWLLD